MMSLAKLEQVRSMLLYTVMAGHKLIPVSRLLLHANRIGRLLRHYRPLEYTPPHPQDPIQRKIYDALDSAHHILYNLASDRSEEIPENMKSFLDAMLTDISQSKDRAYDKEVGPGASLLKRGRKFMGAA